MLPRAPWLSCSLSVWFWARRKWSSLLMWVWSSEPVMKMLVAVDHINKHSHIEWSEDLRSLVNHLKHEINAYEFVCSPESFSASCNFLSNCSRSLSLVLIVSSRRRRNARISCRCSANRSKKERKKISMWMKSMLQLLAYYNVISLWLDLSWWSCSLACSAAPAACLRSGSVVCASGQIEWGPAHCKV